MDLKAAVNVWDYRRIDSPNMPRMALFKEIENFISARSNCALATGNGTYVRNTPMRYSYKNGQFYLVSDGGYKFKSLGVNPHVCLAIYDSDDTGSDTHGLTVEGDAVVTECEVNSSNNNQNKSVAYMITITPKSFDYLDSDLPKRGYYKLQRYVV